MGVHKSSCWHRLQAKRRLGSSLASFPVAFVFSLTKMAPRYVFTGRVVTERNVNARLCKNTITKLSEQLFSVHSVKKTSFLLLC